MSAHLGRLLQITGMVILPAGLIYGFVSGNVRFEVLLLAIGGTCFLAGWLLTKKPEA